VNLCLLPVAVTVVSVPFLAFLGTPNQGAVANAVLSGVVFLLTLLAFFGPGSGLLHADQLGLVFGAVTGFAGFTTAIANIFYVRGAALRLGVKRWRLYHVMCQIITGATLAGLYADNIGVLWAAVEAATIAATLAVSLPRTPSALEAAWKYFILGGVGIALALFGTMLVYLAAQPALGPGLASMSLVQLSGAAVHMDGSLLTLAFVFLLFGYGTKAALAPLHGWLPDAYAEGPAPLTTSLSGLTLNVALIAILRFSHLLQANHVAGGGAMSPGPFLLLLGLVSIFLTAFSLSRRRDSRRFFGFSSIEHSGIAAFAFGIGGPMAIFGGLLHMVLHTLIKSALFQALIRAAALRGSTAPGHYAFSHLRGLVHSNKLTALALGGCIFALTGLPPSGLFASEFIIVSQTIQRQPLASLPLGLGLLICAVAILRNLGPLMFGEAPHNTKHVKTARSTYLVLVHLVLAFLLAFAMPPALYALLFNVAAGLA
jgi:hydrogenase-4 component F